MSSGGGQSPQKRSGGGKVEGRITHIDRALHRQMVQDLADEFNEKYPSEVNKAIRFVPDESSRFHNGEVTIDARVVAGRDYMGYEEIKSVRGYKKKYSEQLSIASRMAGEFNAMGLKIAR